MLRNEFHVARKHFMLACIIVVMLLKTSDANFSDNSTNTEWCYFSSLSEVEKMSFCKFPCWSESDIHLPLKGVDLRRSIVSLNVQITEKDCKSKIGSVHLGKLEKLLTFLIIGHIRTFNLTYLISEAPNLKKLSVSSSELNELFADNLKETRLTSLSLLGLFDPKQWQFIKASRKTLISFYLTLNKKISIPERWFYRMPELQFINLQIVAEKMSFSSFHDLPKLTFLSIQNNYFNYPTKFQNHVFSNLPSLRTMKISSFEIESKNKDDEFCFQLSGNMESFILETSSILFIERCMEVWRCIECGINGSITSQTIEFRNLLTNFKAINTKLDDILPNPAIMFLLNTTRLQLLDTHIPIITKASLERFPMMTHYHHHRSWRIDEKAKSLNSFGDIDRFIDNPFELLFRRNSRLVEVKISINICDCITFQVHNFLLSKNVSFFFYCRNLASENDHLNTDSWINQTFFEEVMTVKCAAETTYFTLGLLIISNFGFKIISFYC